MMSKRSKSTPTKPPRDKGNFIAEWFGHRVYPAVEAGKAALDSQAAASCPFLTLAKSVPTSCVKKANSSGVCTISSVSNGARQDWLACPYRALSPELLNGAIRRLFELNSDSMLVLPAIRLADPKVRREVMGALDRGCPAFMYFDAKLGGELSLAATPRSPEFSFDVTIFELIDTNGEPGVGRFAVLEIQTADFHGSYAKAVKNLADALRLHRRTFPKMVQSNRQWLSDGVEGPNIANVFKRTFYQMMFKFQLARDPLCAGCALSISESVWDSWQKHLARPELGRAPDGSWNLFRPGEKRSAHVPAWILVFESDTESRVTPRPIVFRKVIATDARAISYFALEEAPAAAVEAIKASDGLYGALSARMSIIWPELKLRTRMSN